LTRVNVVYVISGIEKALAFEWTCDYLNKEEFNLSFILLSDSETLLSAFLKSRNLPVFRLSYKTNWQKVLALFNICKILWRSNAHVIHTHLFEANVIGLAAGWLMRVKKRIYTRHHAMTHHRDYLQGRKWDKLCNALATDIIAISKNVEHILVELDCANPDKIRLIPHGFDFSVFDAVPEEQVRSFKSKYSIPDDAYPVVGVISRYTYWKGIQFVVPAFEKLRQQFPKAFLILCNAHGEYFSQVQQLLSALPKDAYAEVRFESNLGVLYKTFNIYVHVPIDSVCEAFGQTYVEALAAKIPSVFTLSGIASEFVVDKKNAIVVPYQNSEEVYRAFIELAAHPERFAEMVNAGSNDVRKRFNIHSMIRALQNLYRQ
jgi:glycosyltransferase involved in cell wall biosynthesis